GMEDVIFSGAGSRPSRNWAEVSLVLDNTDRSAPAQFNDAETLEVTRRIERDHGSSYKINGREVRARDVQLLFADASTGANSPALVRQGQISELINAKPENRRRLLEEAAGITGLHSRRHEAELRLRAAETNLTRLDDVVGQLETQHANLKRQARQASRYRNLSGEIRKTEALVAYSRWAEASEGLADAEQRLGAADERVAGASRVSAQAATVQAEASGSLSPLREREAEAAAALHRLVLARDTLDKEEARARSEADRLTGQLAEIAQDTEREEALRKDADAALEDLTREETEISAAAEGDPAAVAEAEQKLARENEALERGESELDALNAEAADLEARRRSLAGAERDLVDRLENLRGQAERTEEEERTLQPSEETRREQTEASSRYEAETQHLSEAEASLLQAETARADAEARETALRADLATSDADRQRLEAEATALSDLLSADMEGDWPRLIDSLRAAPGYETALAAALGDDLSAALDEAAPRHWAEIDAGPAPALPEGVEPLSKFVEGPARLQRRLAMIGVLIDEAAGGILQRRLAPGQRLVSRDGGLWRWDGFTAASDAKTPEAVRLQQQARLRELAAPRETAIAKAESARTAYQVSKREAAEAREREAELRASVRTARQALTAAREAVERLSVEGRKASARLAALAEARRRLAEDISEAERRQSDTRAAMSALPDGEALRDRLNAARNAVAQFRGEVAEARAVQASVRRDAESRRTRLDEIKLEAQVWTDRTQTAAQRLEALAARAGEAETALDDARAAPERIQNERGALIDQIAAAEGRRSETADALAEAEGKLADADRSLKSAEHELSEAREERARADALVEAARERLCETVERAQETCGREPEGLLELAEHSQDETLPDRDGLETRLDRLRRERENMGGVNLRAEEEAAELETQLEEIHTERTDLEAAIEKLRRAIASLNKEGRERLLTAFEQVNSNFKDLFVKLFDGGQAELRLTESDDPLQAGLEIFASPPGKKLASMTLMSGGEQALTATALIFAVFIANPAPICVLDEVDAPLDDANVDRFCRLMDEMARQTDTRFLCITHHAVTMSRMDRLFGVTMAERGVSQLVSVDLSVAEQIVAAE
ncbi:MAG: chromosome segregation protein SMC, partial [Pseudomonadota bacterium]